MVEVSPHVRTISTGLREKKNKQNKNKDREKEEDESKTIRQSVIEQLGLNASRDRILIGENFKKETTIRI